MVAVGAPRLSIGCYSVPQQSGSVASPAAILRVAPSIDSLVELRGRVYASSKLFVRRMALCAGTRRAAASRHFGRKCH